MTCMLNHSKNVDVSGSVTVVHGNFNSITAYESQDARSLTDRLAEMQALTLLHNNIAAGAMHNSKERYDVPKCHPHTRKAVLNDIISWVSDHSKKTSILWLSAPAGSGKSAILQQISENFHKSGGLAASFFFSRSVAKRNTDTHLIATLASQLATSIPATRPFIERAITRDPSIFQRVLSEQMEHLMVYPLVYASFHPKNGSPWPTLLVIDGLDECNGGDHQADILCIFRDALLQLKRALPRLYLLIASRPEPAITTVFDHELSKITHHLVLDGTYHPDRDIALFLRSSFADIYRRRRARFPSMASLPQPWPLGHVISLLVGKSSGQFIFAATVIRFIDIDRKIPTAQLQLILDICESVDSSRFAANPFALLDDLYTHVLKSSEEKGRALSILGAIFYLQGNQRLTLHFLQALLRLESEDVTMIFWDLHSIIHIPPFDKDPIHFYHASFRDFLMDRHRSGNLYVDGSKAHFLLLRSCIQTLSDFHYKPIGERTTLAFRYSRNNCITHYVCGDQLNPGFLDQVLEEFNPETWLPLDHSADTTTFISWWDDFAALRGRFHGRCDPERCSSLCFQYTSIFDQCLVHWFQKKKNPSIAAALMWLTFLAPVGDMGHEFIRQDAMWLWDIRTFVSDKIQFLYLLMHFLSDCGRSDNLLVASAISLAHFAHDCAQRAWRGILALDHPFGSENWRMLVYLYDILNLLIPRDAPYENTFELAQETIIQYVQMQIGDLAYLVKFVEATGPGEERSPEEQVLRWRDIIRTRGTSSIDFTTALSGEQSLQDEVRTSQSWVKHEGQPVPSSDHRRERRKLIDPDHKAVIEHVPAHRREGKTIINDGCDIEHAIEISDSD